MCEVAKKMCSKREKAKLVGFKEGDKVWVRNYSNGPKWLSGRVTGCTGPVSYEVQIESKGQIVRRHVDQM